MKLIAKKPCSFGGKRFYIGDEIPSEFVLDPQTQEKRGNLTIVADNATVAPPAEETYPEPVILPVIVHAKEGDLPINLTAESLQAVVNVMTSNVEDAANLIKEMSDRDALALLFFADSRKTVQQAAEAQARAVDEAASAAAEDEEASEDEEESEGEQ